MEITGGNKVLHDSQCHRAIRIDLENGISPPAFPDAFGPGGSAFGYSGQFGIPVCPRPYGSGSRAESDSGSIRKPEAWSETKEGVSFGWESKTTEVSIASDILDVGELAMTMNSQLSTLGSVSMPAAMAV